MKNKSLIILVSLLAVFICLILLVLLFCAVKPEFLVVLSFVIGMVTGICTAFLILGLRNTIRDRRAKREKAQS
jgi:Na+-driven multidrug efflux pump